MTAKFPRTLSDSSLANFAKLVAAPQPALRCPSFSVPIPWMDYSLVSPSVAGAELLVNNYYACMGGGPISTTSGATADGCYQSFGTAGGRMVTFTNGLIGPNTRFGVRDCTDGTSNTVLAGESMYQGLELNRGWFVGWRTNSTNNNNPTQMCGTAGAPNGGRAHFQLFTIGGVNANVHNAINTYFFGSMHPGGCHYAMADGSVQFMSENINLSTYQRLGAMNDGLPVGGFTP